MANIESAKKRARQTVVRRSRNQARMSRLRTFVKKVETALAGGQKGEASSAFTAMMSVMHRSVSQGIMHRNTAARKLSRLSARIKALG
jgi:small subunit ribosomal protein S20